MRNIGIVCEGPTDFFILCGIIDTITGEKNHYKRLQPEDDLRGQFGTGWKGVWKWCRDNAAIKKKLMTEVQPQLEILVVQMDGDVSRKEKPPHCLCEPVECSKRGKQDVLLCDISSEKRNACPVTLPCENHDMSVNGYVQHLTDLLVSLLQGKEDTCITIPCDSIESWIVAAYDSLNDVESLLDPWNTIIAKKKYYHGIRIRGDQKNTSIFLDHFMPVVCENWNKVTQLCQSAKKFEEDILLLIKKEL